MRSHPPGKTRARQQVPEAACAPLVELMAAAQRAAQADGQYAAAAALCNLARGAHACAAVLAAGAVQPLVAMLTAQSWSAFHRLKRCMQTDEMSA